MKRRPGAPIGNKNGTVPNPKTEFVCLRCSREQKQIWKDAAGDNFAAWATDMLNRSFEFDGFRMIVMNDYVFISRPGSVGMRISKKQFGKMLNNYLDANF